MPNEGSEGNIGASIAEALAEIPIAPLTVARIHAYEGYSQILILGGNSGQLGELATELYTANVHIAAALTALTIAHTELRTYLEEIGTPHPQDTSLAAIPAEPDPDGPYEQTRLVKDSRTGEQRPARELVDDTQLMVGARELIEQAARPRPLAALIPPKEVPHAATSLLNSLQGAVGARPPTSQTTLPDGRILRTYDIRMASPHYPGRTIFVTTQLAYETVTADTPVSGNLSITVPTGQWPREYYFQAEPTPQARGDEPLIYYDDYPFNRDDLGRPERNTAFSLEQAQKLIALVPGPTD